jgi:hypothetical protein
MDPETKRFHRDMQVVIVVPGSQGERLYAMSADEHLSSMTPHTHSLSR